MSFRYGEYVFMSCCGLYCFWKLKCGDLLTFGDLSLAFFGLVLYFTERLHCLIPDGQTLSLFQVFNLRVEIVAERLSWTWSGVLTCTQKCGNHQPHLLELIYDWICSSGGSQDWRLSSLRTGARRLMSNI